MLEYEREREVDEVTELREARRERLRAREKVSEVDFGEEWVKGKEREECRAVCSFSIPKFVLPPYPKFFLPPSTKCLLRPPP